MNQSFSALVWTTEPPTEPGEWKFERDGEIYLGFVYKRLYGELVFDAVDRIGRNRTWELKRLHGGRWCPILTPAEPAPAPEESGS